MVAVVKEMCVFMIIAQAILFFVPGSVYVKYVRVLVGIIMIMGITGSLFGVLMDEEKKQEIRQRMELLEENISMEGEEIVVWENEQDIYGAIEQELKERLEKCESNYRILDVEIAGDKVAVTVEESLQGTKEQEIIRIELVTLEETEEKGGSRGSEESQAAEDVKALKELFGKHIGVDAENIEIIFR